MGRTIAAGLGNAVLGVLAVAPLVVAASLVAYLANGPYPPQTGHTSATLGGKLPPFEIDGDEAGVAVLFLVIAGGILGVLFLGLNAPVARRLPDRAAAVWLGALLIVLLPFAGVMAYWWLHTPPL